MNFDEHLEKFYYYLSSEKRYSNNTLESYSNDLKLLTNFLESKKKKNWKSITELDITHYFKGLDKSLSKNTTKRKYASIKSFFKFMLQEGYIHKNILMDIKSPKSSSAIPKPLSIKEMDMILMKSNTSKKFSRDTSIFTTMYAAGLRVSEVLNINLGGIKINDKTLKVSGKGSKERILPIYQGACKELEYYIKNIRPFFSKDNDFYSLLFTDKNSKPMTRQYVWRSLKIRALKVGIKKNVSPHMIRHSYATHLLQGGASIRHVQEFLGHNSVESTQIYTKIPNQRLIKDYNLAHPRGNQ